MSLSYASSVSVESWVELAANTPMTYEVDTANDTAILFFGNHSEYVLKLSQANLGQMLELGGRAAAELASVTPDDDESL